jgi:MFS family permease
MAYSAEAETLPAAPPRAARLAVATIFCANGAAIANWVVRIPDVKQRLGLSDGQLGLALLCAAAGAFSSQLVTGWLNGRFGTRVMTTALALLFCAAIPLPVAATSLPLLMLALFIYGATNGGLDVSMNGQAVLVEKRYGRPILSSFHGLWSVGGLLGASVGGVIAGRRIDPLLHLAVVACVAVVVMLIALRGLLPDRGTHGSSEPGFALPPRALIPLGVIAFGVLFAEGAVGDWSAVYLRDHLNTTPGRAATAFVVFSLVMTVGRLSGDWLTERLGARTIVRGSGALVMAGVALVMLASAPLVAIAGFGLVGAGVAICFPLVISAAAATPGVANSTAITAMATVGYTGFLIGPPLIGSLADLISLRWAFGSVLGVLGVLIVLLAGRVGRRAA